MEFIEQTIKGVFIVKGQPIQDSRGAFRRHFCAREFEQHGLNPRVSQANVSENKFKHTLRGFHYQIGPYSEAKTISVLRGAIFDIVVDLRVESKTFMKWISVQIKEEDRSAIHIPIGCANAFLSLAPDTMLQYYSSEFYNPQAEKGIRYNDPAFKFIWPSTPEVISEKDSSWPDFVVPDKP